MTTTKNGPMVGKLAPGVVGEAKLEEVTVSRDASAWSAWSGSSAYVDPGRYLRLYVGGELMMSDTPHEVSTNYDIVARAHGDVLIGGLGLGMVVDRILGPPRLTDYARRRAGRVRSLTVVEKSPDVIRLIGDQLKRKRYGGRLTIVEGDIFDWRPEKGVKYDAIYFDIWPTICTDNLEQIARLHQAFKGRKRPGAWMDSWMADHLRCERRRERAAGW